MTLSTHVLDASRGRPAAAVALTLYRRAGDAWDRVGTGITDEDGRCATLAPDELAAAVYRLVFDTGAYFRSAGISGYFYPEVSISFRVAEPERHHHVPLLLSPYAYSTYRGS